MARAAGAPLSEKPLSVTPPIRTAVAIPMSANTAPRKIESKMAAMRRSPIPATRKPLIREAELEGASWTRAAGGGGEGRMGALAGAGWTGRAVASCAPQTVQKRAESSFGFPQEMQNNAVPPVERRSAPL